MSFNSYTFIIFFAIVLLLYRLLTSWRGRKIVLLIASYLFYAAWHPPFVMLLAISTLVDWFSGKRVAATDSLRKKRLFLLMSLTVNLGMLGFFKYAGFVLDNFIWLLSLANIQYHPPRPDIVLPIGISFFTFQSITYTFDVYRGKATWPSFLDFALFVSFFPKLVIGPITRAHNFLQQCSTPSKADGARMMWGIFLFFVGLFEKIVLADNLLAPIADQLFNARGIPTMTGAWTGSLAFAGQILFDFAGYSSCAIGAALCLGFELPQNFNYPYAAIGFSDFWKRWHISLSSWLRDYLYISLGGNREGSMRTYANLMITMLLAGLWHGASWTFIVWGGLHGLYQVLERWARRIVPPSDMWSSPALRVLLALLTFLLVSLAWVFFRSDSFSQAFTILGALFGFTKGEPSIKIEDYYVLLTFGLIFLVLVWHWYMRERSLKDAMESMPWWVTSAVLAGLIVAIVTCGGEDRAFIYFQF